MNNNTFEQVEQPTQYIQTALDIEPHWDIRNPLNIIPALILLAILIGISSSILHTI